MTVTANQIGSILILALVTIVLSIYTLVGMRWWLKNGPKWYGWAKINRFLVFVALGSQCAAFAAVVLAPIFLLAYLMNDVELVKNIGTNGRTAVFLTCLAPGVIYNLISELRKNRPK